MILCNGPIPSGSVNTVVDGLSVFTSTRCPKQTTGTCQLSTDILLSVMAVARFELCEQVIFLFLLHVHFVIVRGV